MKIAVTSENRIHITDHAGRCRKFWVYETQFADVVEKYWLEVSTGQRFHDVNVPDSLHDINVLITAGMASDLRYRLKQHAIQTVVTLETDPDRAVTAWLNGTLEEIPPYARIAPCSNQSESAHA